MGINDCHFGCHFVFLSVCYRAWNSLLHAGVKLETTIPHALQSQGFLY